MKKTLLASAVVVLVGATGSVWANDRHGGDGPRGGGGGGEPTTAVDISDVHVDLLSHNNLTENSTNKNSGDSKAIGARSVALNNGSVASFSNAFNKTQIAATSTLKGSVSGIGLGNIGNWVQNGSSADGGGASGGAGGAGTGGVASSGAQSSSGGGSGGNDVARGYGRGDKGGGSASNDVGNTSSTASGGTGGSGGGAVAGAGGSNNVSAGTFNMSSNMANVGQSAAGIMVVSQNSGFASLAQQSVNVQSNLSVK